MKHNKSVPQTVLGGWKGSAVCSACFFGFSIVELTSGNFAVFAGYIAAGAGWAGWAMQEWQHLNGYTIDE